MFEALFTLGGWWGLLLVALGMAPLLLLRAFRRAVKA